MSFEFRFPAAYDAAQWLAHQRRQGARLLVLHEPHRRVPRCSICSRRLDTADLWSLDCGGDCLGCIRECDAWAAAMVLPKQLGG